MKNAGKSFRKQVAKLSEYEAEICRYRTVSESSGINGMQCMKR